MSFEQNQLEAQGKFIIGKQKQINPHNSYTNGWNIFSFFQILMLGLSTADARNDWANPEPYNWAYKKLSEK